MDYVPSVGPDVIVGDLYDLTRWGQNPAGTIQAYSVGTYSCNIGNQQLLWVSNSSNHPVIGENMYRLKGGRFEQLGQSWLKWAFLALTDSICGVCQNPGTGARLGINCSDPYSASLNGQQSGLGPKSVINPFTGSLPASHSTPGSATIDGRLQVATADVDPNQNVGALYVVEGQYITPDDAAAGNLYNNASWRRIWVSSNYNISFSGPNGVTSQTVRATPAIMAWKFYDPAVRIIQVDAPGDGRAYVACRSYRVDASTWRHEFAVFNMNCNRAFGSFRVFLPQNPSITAVYFHDVAYHSGEPYSGTDWSNQVDSSGILFSTQTYAQNPNANALRWGTLYNFGFTAQVSPDQISMVELGLFKPGSPDTIVVDIPSQPNNESCYRPYPVSQNGTYVFDNQTSGVAGPSEACGFDGTTGNDAWFRYEAPSNGTAVISTCGSGFDTLLAVYTGGCPDSPGTAIACDDDTCGVQSQVSVPVLGGQSYLIRVAGKAGATGIGQLNITLTDNGGVWNDICANAQLVGEGDTFFDNLNALSEGPLEPTCSGQNWNSGNDRDVWFKFLAACTGTLRVRTCGSSFNTKLAVYANACPAGSGSVVACNDNACSQQSEVSFSCTAGTWYYIRVGGNNGASGANGRLQVQCMGSASLCPNDTETGATTIPSLPYSDTSSTLYCNNDYDEYCPWGNSASPDSVYRYTPAANQTIDISLCSADFDTKLSIYDHHVQPGLALACNDDGCPGAPPASYTSQIHGVSVTAGTPYLIVVDGFGGQAGNYTLTVTEAVQQQLGDLNCDGLVDFADIDPFVTALSGQSSYEAAYPGCNWMNADCNNDSFVDFADIDPFVALLGG